MSLKLLSIKTIKINDNISFLITIFVVCKNQ